PADSSDPSEDSARTRRAGRGPAAPAPVRPREVRAEGGRPAAAGPSSRWVERARDPDDALGGRRCARYAARFAVLASCHPFGVEMHFLDLSDPRDRTLHGILRRQPAAIPDATYRWADDEKISFAEVEARANAWAVVLRELGVQRGDSVAFLLKSCPEFVYATFGCLQLGAIWIPVNVDYRGAWLRATLED